MARPEQIKPLYLVTHHPLVAANDARIIVLKGVESPFIGPQAGRVRAEIEKSGESFHIGLVADGNRRDAREHGLEELAGHIRGTENVIQLADVLSNSGATDVSLWGMSPDNYTKRKSTQVENIYHTAAEGLERAVPKVYNRGGRIIHIGRTDRIPPEFAEKLAIAEEKTRNNDRYRIWLLFDYARINEDYELAHDVAVKVEQGLLGSRDITYDRVEDMTEGRNGERRLRLLPPMHVLIRTGVRNPGGAVYLSSLGPAADGAYFYSRREYLSQLRPKTVLNIMESYQRTPRRAGS
jgi:undecaprenyl diphosphate synthase